MPRASLLLLLILSATSCGGDDLATLVVDVRSDWIGGVEVVRIRSQLTVGSVTAPPSSDREIVQDVAPGTDLVMGRRVASFEGLAPGTFTLRVVLLDGEGSALGSRTAEVVLERDLGLLIAVTRDCVEVECPASGDPTATECLSETCVSARCHSGNAEACPDLEECITAGDCSVSACATAACMDGLCLTTPDSSMCGSAEICDVSRGCIPASCVGAPEVDACDGIDGDCDGTIDEDHDLDRDGFTSCGAGVLSMADCDDTQEAINPGAAELCDTIDNDCDGDVDELVCACDALDVDGRSYWACASSGSWDEASDICRGFGQLWKIDDAAENDAVFALLPAAMVANYYIGLRRDADGDFRWEDGATPSYTRWAMGEPMAQPCAVIDGRGGVPPTWKSSLCSATSSFVCEEL